MNRILHLPGLPHQITRLVRRDTSGNDRAADPTNSSERHFAGHVYEGDVLVFAEEREMEEDRERGGVACEHDELGYAAVEGFGR
jgi:hypothetical protein